MLIQENHRTEGVRELKVHIPIKYHLQLHRLKVLEGRHIHGVVEEALAMWFEKLNADQHPA